MGKPDPNREYDPDEDYEVGKRLLNPPPRPGFHIYERRTDIFSYSVIANQLLFDISNAGDRVVATFWGVHKRTKEKVMVAVSCDRKRFRK